MWNKAGTNARDIFLMHKLDILLQTLVSTITKLKIDRITMVNAQGGSGNLLARSEEMKATLGVDIPGLVNDVAKRLKPSQGKPSA